MTKQKLKDLINKYVGYGEQEIYDALDNVYDKEKLREAFDAGFAQGIDVGEHGIYSTKPGFEEWFNQNVK